MKQKVLDAYMDGSPITIIVSSFNTTTEEVLKILHTYKEESRYKKTFTDDFKKMISERDLNGVARSQIAKELELNVSTVKKACEKFGQAVKDKAISDKAFTRIDGEFDKKTCPSCNIKRVNEVEENTTYCLNCGDEYIHREGYVLKVNFEYLEE